VEHKGCDTRDASFASEALRHKLLRCITHKVLVYHKRYTLFPFGDLSLMPCFWDWTELLPPATEAMRLLPRSVGLWSWTDMRVGLPKPERQPLW
jgi:hypothetical protein